MPTYKRRPNCVNRRTREREREKKGNENYDTKKESVQLGWEEHEKNGKKTSRHIIGEI